MRRISLLLCLGFFALAGSAAAQTKLSGTLECSKSNPRYRVPVGERAGHSLVLEQQKCVWTTPIAIENIKAKDAEATLFSDQDGDRSRDTGYQLTNMSTGEQVVFRMTGTGSIGPDGSLSTENGTWTLFRATGKLEGIKGHGTYKGVPNAQGGVTLQVQGEYETPSTKP